jgi:pyruvate dehydrogenase E2 component (dihydrolipoamide acetyltransferase)
MPEFIRMPKLSPTMESGRLAKWIVAVGTQVNTGDVIMEIDTDKASIEHETVDSGYVRELLVNEGDDVSVGQPLAIISQKPDEPIEDWKKSNFSVSQSEQEKPAPSHVTNNNESGSQSVSAVQRVVDDPVSINSIKNTINQSISPAAKRLALQKGISTEELNGSGPNGRIILADIQKVISVKKTVVAEKNDVCVPEGFEPMSDMRKVIAKRLELAKKNIPHFYVSIDVDMTSLLTLRTKLKNDGQRVTLNDFIIKAVAIACQDFPSINAQYHSPSQSVKTCKRSDISVAVSLNDGLITPIVFEADKKSISEISENVKLLVSKAKDGNLKPSEFEGGSFTISNLGMFGVTHFQAIVNPPQVAILAVGGVTESVVLDAKHQPSIKQKMTMTISCDHRVVDGVVASQFLNHVKSQLETPNVLLE